MILSKNGKNQVSNCHSFPARTLRVHVGTNGSYRKFTLSGEKPSYAADPPRTLLRTFRVQSSDLPRTCNGPSAYFHRTFRVPVIGSKRYKRYK